jgi:hypothetical protein
LKTAIILLGIVALMLLGGYWIEASINDVKDQKYRWFGFDVMMVIFAIMYMARAIFGTFA